MPVSAQYSWNLSGQRSPNSNGAVGPRPPPGSTSSKRWTPVYDSTRVAGVTQESARLAGVPSHTYLEGCNPGASAFNWRDLKRVTATKNQQDCGSCWAFSASEAFEDSYYAQSGKQINVSPQNLLDCSGKDSCSGGWYYNAFKYMQTHGVSSEADVPYANNYTNKPRI